MLEFLSNLIVDFLLKKKVIKQEEAEIYVYGFQIIISSLFGIIIVCILGILLKSLPLSLIFLFVFIITRKYCGGYHARTFFRCCFLFLFSFLAILSLKEILIDRLEIYHIICFLLIYLMTIFQYAPIENENKKISEKSKVSNRNKSIILSFLWSIIALALYSFSKELSLMIILTLALVTILILIVELRKVGQT